MLKLPMGCASLACGCASQQNSRNIKKTARAILWSRICRPLARHGHRAIRNPLQRGSGEICVEQMELRIQCDRSMQIVLGLFGVAQGLVYHARVKHDERVVPLE